MSLGVSVSGRAETDLTHQYRWYLDHASEDVAERFLSAFQATISRLAEHPDLGRRRRFRAPELVGIRSFPLGDRFGVHLLFYHTHGRKLVVERVMHGARDLPNRLQEPPGPEKT